MLSLLQIYFFKIAYNDRGYGHGRVAGVFAVAQRQSECGRKTRKVHVSQPVNIGILWLFQIICIKKSYFLCIVLVLCTNLNSENNMLKIKPSVIEKISTRTAFGCIFSINLAHVIFVIYWSFTKSETKKKLCLCRLLFQWMCIIQIIFLSISNNGKYPMYQFVSYVV